MAADQNEIQDDSLIRVHPRKSAVVGLASTSRETLFLSHRLKEREVCALRISHNREAADVLHGYRAETEVGAQRLCFIAGSVAIGGMEVDEPVRRRSRLLVGERLHSANVVLAILDVEVTSIRIIFALLHLPSEQT
jgi:hypothetical protein